MHPLIWSIVTSFEIETLSGKIIEKNKVSGLSEISLTTCRIQPVPWTGLT